MEIEYLPRFLALSEAEALFDTLLKEVDWQEEWLTLYGRRMPVPRLLSWCGDAEVNYRYSGTDHVCRGWLPALVPVRRRLARRLDFATNLVLMNRYRTGRDHMGWHTDDERGLAGQIASLSLGASRRFLVRFHKDPSANAPVQQRSHGLELEPGSLLLMSGTLRHALPRTRKPVGERINLTFRWVEPRL